MKKIYTICLLSVFSNNILAQCYTAVKTIGSTTIALQTDGTLWSWGNNSSGILGTGNENITAINVPIAQIGTDNNWSKKVDFLNHALVLKNDGTLWAWGNNQVGQCGNGTSGNQNRLISPEQITTDIWLDVAVGSAYSLAVRSDGTLWAWGINDHGQLGTGNNANYLVPTRVGTDNNWAKVFCGSLSSFGIKTDGSLWVWGHNYALTIFGSTSGNEKIPGRIGVANDWKSVSPTALSVLALKTDGTLWIWGQNQSSSFHAYYGNGYPDMGNYENNPTQIGTDANWQNIASSQHDFYAIKNNGALWDWGKNQVAELGDGTTIPKYFPTQLGTDNDWEAIDTDNDDRVYALKGNSIYRWGYFANPTTANPVLYGIDCVLGTVSFNKENQITVFPNPTNGKVTLRSEVNLLPTASIMTTNFLGQPVAKNESYILSSKEVAIDCSTFADGIYFITLKNGDEVYTTKISKH